MSQSVLDGLIPLFALTLVGLSVFVVPFLLVTLLDEDRILARRNYKLDKQQQKLNAGKKILEVEERNEILEQIIKEFKDN